MVKSLRLAMRAKFGDGFEKNPEYYIDLAFNYIARKTVIDRERAFKCFGRARDLGSVQGMHFRACCYLDGVGVQKNIRKAIYLFVKSYDLGCKDSIVYLDRMHEKKTYSSRLLRLFQRFDLEEYKGGTDSSDGNVPIDSSDGEAPLSIAPRRRGGVDIDELSAKRFILDFCKGRVISEPSL